MPPKVVVDSSVILKWLYREDEKYLEKAELLLKNAVGNKVELLAPELAKYEVGNVLLVAKKLPQNSGEEALETYYSLPIQYISLTEKLSKETFFIGKKINITFYDASFIALARQERATLVTDNPKHQRKFPGVKVIPLKEYK